MLATVVLAVWLSRPAVSQPTLDRDEFFEKKIRPALAEHCLACHSNATEINGGLLLDSASGWKKGGESGKAIEPGNPNAGLFVKAIEYEDPQLQMPPDGKMPVRVIEDFRKWIREGAFDPREASTPAKPSTALPLERAQEHWAYRPVQPTEVPTSKGLTDIDRFIQAQLDAKNLKANEPASKAVLIRRLTYDLHGLPPTPAELAEFEADNSDEAYDKLVDRLLASPRYAERMAKHWLDVVRYGESLTLRGFVLGNAWRYRDYCIQAFEEDRPWNEVMREQIAGDLMNSDELHVQQRRKVAVAFWLMGNSNLEEQDKQQLEMDVVDEQLDTFGKVFLGQTIGCARCHDHKFDPIPTRDYYALAGVMKSWQPLKHSNVSVWIDEPLPLPADEAKYFDDLEAESKELAAEVDRLRRELTRATKRKTPIVLLDELPGIIVDDKEAEKIGDWQSSTHTHAYVADGYIHDKNELKGTKTVSFEPKKLPPGTYEVRFAYASHPARAKDVKVTVYSADGDRLHEIDQTQTPPIEGLWISLGKYRFEKDGQAYVLVSNEDTDGPVIADAVQFLSEEDLKLTSKQRNNPKPSDPNEDDDPEQAGRKATLEKELKQAEAKKKKLDDKIQERPKALAMLPVPEAGDIPIHIRGDAHNLGKVVPRGTLQLVSLSNKPTSSRTTTSSPVAPSSGRGVGGEGATAGALDNASPFSRLDLADWLANENNPLPARIMVNRVWSWLMGDGLVRTMDNFGTTGEAPSHPELLDYLAHRFVHEGWSVRKLVREIVSTEAYRRRSDSTVTGESVDPDNRMLWRGQRRRLEAEVIRDTMLMISGQLDEQRFGSHLPKGLKSDYGYVHNTNVRSVYVPVLRNAMPDLFDVFDVADSSSVVGKRNRSTTAGQALWMMNHPWVSEVSKAAAERIIETNPTSIDDQINFTAQSILGRGLTQAEQSAFAPLLTRITKDSSTDSLATIIRILFQSIDFRFVP